MAQKETKFTLGGKEYTLKFSMRVPLYWEKATQKNYFQAFGAGKNPSLTDILTLVWATLKNGGCSLSLEDMADQLSDKDLQSLSNKVMDLVAKNSSQAEEGEKTVPLDEMPQR